MTRPRYVLDRVVYNQDGTKGDIIISGNNTVWTLRDNINKDWTGTHSFLDDSFEIRDDSDETKKVQFQLSGVSTGTTRTLTVPDASGTIALAGGSGTISGLSAGYIPVAASGTTLGNSNIVDSSGKIGVGTASPGAFSYDSNGNLVVFSSGNTSISVVAATTGYSDLAFADGVTGAERYAGLVRYDHANDSLDFWSAGVERLSIDNSGNATLSGSMSSPNFRDSINNHNVNLANEGTEGRGVVAGFSGGNYSGIGYNLRFGDTSDTWIAPIADSASQISFSQGGFVFYGWPTGSAGRTITATGTEKFRITVDGAFGLSGANYGTSGQVLTSAGSGSSPTWTTPLTNPMTTGGDIIYGGASGTPTRLANGSSGQVLTSNGSTNAPSWETPVGFADPMTTRGDIIYRNSSNITARLGVGSADYVLTSDGTDVAWATIDSSVEDWSSAGITYGTDWSATTGVEPGYKKFGGMVFLRGRAEYAGTWDVGDTILTLPAGYRPSVTRVVPATTSDNTGGPLFIQIADDGQVIIWEHGITGGNPSSYSAARLDGISFSL